MSSTDGVLRESWSTAVDDYAIDGGWAQEGQVLIVGDSAGGLYALDGKSGVEMWSRAAAHGGGLLKLAIRSEGTECATAGQDGRVVIWDIPKGQVLNEVAVGDGWVENVAWSPDGKWLAATSSRCVHVFDASGGELWRSNDHPSTVSTITWTTANELVVACYGQVIIYAASAGALIEKFEWQGSLVSMVLSPDGNVVVCGSQDNSVHFWRRSNGKESMMSGFAGKPMALAFNSTGNLLATGGDTVVTVWSFQGNGPEGTQPMKLDLHSKTVCALTFAPDGRRLASGGRDGVVAMWLLQETGEGELTGFVSVSGTVAGLHWRPDGDALAALDARGGVTVWELA